MAWGCKPENKPDGCGWANRDRYPSFGLEEWWCDLCDRSGDVLFEPTKSRAFRPDGGER